eukprot:m.31382 g.31382  ORF g.31382 m.31382 type:complete len:370 (+) comp12066_c0_seq1:2-1111(+)
MQDVMIVLEPEAASRSVLKQIDASIEPHERYMIVDCGGGTVDLVTHELQEDGGVKEVAVGSGGCCGGSYVDQAYLDYLSERFGFFDQFKRTKQQHYYKLLANWEMTKINFTGQSDHSTDIDLPPGFLRVAEEHLDDDEVDSLAEGFEIPVEDMRGFFDGVVDKIMELAKLQLGESGAVHKIIFVGGFARSKYLQQRAKAELETVETRVIIPPSPASAVLKGAVLLRAEPTAFVKERIARQTYGICVSMPFVKGKHNDAHSTVDAATGTLLATNAFHPFVLRKQSLAFDEQVSHKFQAGQSEVQVRLYKTSARDVPATIDEPGVGLLGRVTIPDVEIGSTLEIGMTFGDTAIHAVVTTSSGERPFIFHLD